MCEQLRSSLGCRGHTAHVAHPIQTSGMDERSLCSHFNVGQWHTTQEIAIFSQCWPSSNTSRENKVSGAQEGFASQTVSPIVSHVLSGQMFGPSVSLIHKSDFNPLTGHESETFEMAHMGMFWQSLGADEKKKGTYETNSVYCTFPQCHCRLSSTNTSWAKKHEVSGPSTSFVLMERHQKTVCGHEAVCSGWDRGRCYKQEPELREAYAVRKMTNTIGKKPGPGIIRGHTVWIWDPVDSVG